jgi:hypothetical protein
MAMIGGLLDASTSTNILKVLGNSGDEVIATGFDDSTIDKITQPTKTQT